MFECADDHKKSRRFTKSWEKANQEGEQVESIEAAGVEQVGKERDEESESEVGK